MTKNTTFARWSRLLMGVSATSLLLSSCGVMQVANNANNVNSALASGKAVLISNPGTFNPDSDVSESIELSGKYRPPLTYWIHRDTQKAFVLGARDSDDGKGKVLTTNHYYYVMEPGIYDFAGYVKKERLGSLKNLTLTKKPIKSSIGFVNFSATTLPTFYTYQAWVPPSYTGTTLYGNTLTNWYAPGYWTQRGARRATSGIFVDMRGLVPNAPNGKANIASFILAPGQIAVAPDFKAEFTHGECDLPTEGQYVCPLTSLTMAAPFADQAADVRETMKQFMYSADLIKKVTSAHVLPGEFFRNQKMELARGLKTASGDAYAQFRVTENTMPAPASK